MFLLAYILLEKLYKVNPCVFVIDDTFIYFKINWMYLGIA